MFVDQHLSETVELLRTEQLGPIDIAVIEATAITADGALIPTTSVGNSASFAILIGMALWCPESIFAKRAVDNSNAPSHMAYWIRQSRIFVSTYCSISSETQATTRCQLSSRVDIFTIVSAKLL
jgi:hypothetical protein